MVLAALYLGYRLVCVVGPPLGLFLGPWLGCQLWLGLGSVVDLCWSQGWSLGPGPGLGLGWA